MTTLIIDYRTNNFEVDNLLSHNCNIIKCPKHPVLYSSIDGHPDIQIFVKDDSIILQNQASEEFKKILSQNAHNKKIIFSNNTLEKKYPNNIFLNCLCLKDYFIHFLKHTDPKVIKAVKDKILINVKQGYTKCSTAVVSDSAIITSDESIYNALTKTSVDALLIPPGDILLPGLNYGFIGGTCGLISEDKLAFFGNLKYYKYGTEVKKFLYKHNVEPIYLRDDVLIDRGSILRI